MFTQSALTPESRRATSGGSSRALVKWLWVIGQGSGRMRLSGKLRLGALSPKDEDGKMKRISVALIIGAGLLFLVNGARAEERERCSNATLHGNFGLRATGAIVDSGNLIVIGRFTYDGKGNL